MVLPRPRRRLYPEPDAGTAAHWGQLVQEYREAGATRLIAHQLIAAEFGVPMYCVWRHVEPEAYERQRRLARAHEQTPEYRERARLKTKQYRARPDVHERRVAREAEARRRPEAKAYQRWYHRLIRKPEIYGLGAMLSDREPHDCQDVSSRLQELTGCVFAPETAGSFMRRYIERNRGPPYVEEIEPGVYRARRDPP